VIARRKFASRQVSLLLSLTTAISCCGGQARAAGTAFAVDTSEVSETGSCKIESWYSAASNQDAFATINPSCVVDLFGRAIEIGAQFARQRADEEWATSITPKVRTKLIPTAIGSFGLAIAGGASFDAATGETTSVFAYAPATLRLSEVMRININAGWLLDNTTDRNYLTWGIGYDWKLTNVITLTLEAFGQAGDSEVSTVTEPRFQAGLRYRPVDRFSIDLIYGRNINGENANWITLATTIRFPPEK
jgi:hypothetical protein